MTTIVETQQSKNEFLKKLWYLVLPITFQQFMLALVSATDAVMLGFVSQDSLSAVSLATQISFVESLFLMALTVGQSTLVAQYYGKKEMNTVRMVSVYALKLAFVVSMLFTLAALCIPQGLMRLFTNDVHLIAAGADYLRVVSLSYLFTGLSQIYLCLLKNCGYVDKVSLISSAGVVVNIVLNAVLIFGLCGLPRLEIKGAAIATVTAKAIEFLWSMMETVRQKEWNLFPLFTAKIDPFLKKQFQKYTTPVLLNKIVWGIGITMYSVILGHLGSDVVAANSLANIVKNLSSCFCGGIEAAAVILTGNELGAGNLEKAKVYGRKICHLAIASGIFSGMIILAVTPFIVRFSRLSPQSTQYLKWMLIMCSYYIIGKAVNGTTIGGIFCSGGDSKFGLQCDTVTMWIIIVPLAFLAAFVLKLPVLVVCFILHLDEIIKLPAVYFHYTKYLWVKDLTRERTA